MTHALSRRDVLAGAGVLTLAVTGASAQPAAKVSGAAATHELDDADALGLARLVATKQVSAVELLERAIARTEALNPQFNFIAHKLYDYAKARIAGGLPGGPFTGVPWLVKDLNTHIADQPTGQGSRFFTGYRATVTSELVRRHERAGLVIFGKTTTPEFGLTTTTESLATGATRNPWNREHIAGGSSGGAAVAVAAGIVPAAHATDGGGSIRIPASCCGLFGLKPSRGRVPMGPLRTEGWGGMSTHHAVTRSVRDSAALLDATHGGEVGSRYGAPSPPRTFLEEVARDPGKLRIALMLAPPSGAAVDADCIAAVRAAAKLCEGLGHHVTEDAPKLDVGAMGRASFALMSTAIAADLEDRKAATGIAIGPDVIEKVTLVFYQQGLATKGIDVARANAVAQATAITVAQFMEGYDVILSPTLAAPPPKIGLLGLSPDDVATYYQGVAAFNPFAGLYNLTGAPSMSVPLATSSDGLPIGVMFSARYGEEAILFRLAAQLERAAPWAGRRPRV